MSKLALFNGKPIRTEPYPKWPVFDEREVEAVTAVITSGNWGGYPYPGPNTIAFLQQFLEVQGGKYAVAMVNGTVTMEVALRAADIGWGDEVIVPAYTFHATASAPMAAGAIPVIVDIDPETCCIDPKSIEAAITEKTKAIIPVHIAAQMADMDAIMALADKYNLFVVEDCAHAPGAKWRGQGAGTIGHFGSFSLQSTKSLTSGEGGVLFCKTPELAQRAASIVDCGRPHQPGGVGEGGTVYTMGTNYRMTELQTAVAKIAIERFPEQAAQRAEMGAYLEEALSEVPGVNMLRRDPRHTARSFYKYIFKVDQAVFGIDHKTICRALTAEGIPCWDGYPPMNRYDLFQPGLSKLPVPSAFPEYFKFESMAFPVTERVSSQEAIWLDESIFRAGKQGVDDVIAALQKVFDQRELLTTIV